MSASPTHVTAIDLDVRLIEVDPVDLEPMITRVLARAHGAAEAVNEPTRARAILEVAHCFADELAAANPRFDRIRFIEACTTVGA